METMLCRWQTTTRYLNINNQIGCIRDKCKEQGFSSQVRIPLLLSSSQVVVKFTIQQKEWEKMGNTTRLKNRLSLLCAFVFLHPRYTKFNLVSRFYNWGIGWPPPCLPLVDRLLLCPPPLFLLVGGFIVISVFLALGLISKVRRDLLTKQECILGTFYW